MAIGCEKGAIEEVVIEVLMDVGVVNGAGAPRR